MLNQAFEKLEKNYLFEQITKKKEQYLHSHPEAKLINLGIGDTTLPLPQIILQAMQEATRELGTTQGYSGYESFNGRLLLRKKIAENLYKSQIDPDEITVSDGAKCDLGRLQWLFGRNLRIGVQDPSYPVYNDVSILSGSPSPIKLPCAPENNFFPSHFPPLDLIYICSPNNPTGAVATKEQLSELVAYAKEHNALIIYDSAYSSFIQDDALPRSIYEIEGAKEVAIEISSFSKLIGFTGVRLGWTIVPHLLGIKPLWDRILSTFFNGASNIAQAGGIAALSEEGLEETQKRIHYYLQNAKLLKSTFEKLGYPCYGGEHAPYVWIDLQGKSSWEVFDELLQSAHLITTPGSGFGPHGKGFLRVSSLGNIEDVKEATERLQKLVAPV